MPHPVLPIDKLYKNRSADKVICNLQLDRQAVRMLHEYAEGPRAIGRFLNELIYAYQRREAFLDFLKGEVRKELRELCHEVRKDVKCDSRV
jgi:hypothetical protein